MNNKKDHVIEMNIFFYILIIYILSILCCDYFTYLFSMNYWLSLFGGILISCFVAYLLRKKIRIKNEFQKSDLIFFFLLGFILIITIVFPDKMFDSLNYHLLNQEQPFKDITGKYFFPSSNINSTTFALGDRLFYPLRLLFGYRLGLILNYLYIIIIYYQLKKLMKYFIKTDNNIFIAIVTTFSVLTLSILDVLDTYYVDLLSVVCLLQLAIFVFCGQQLSDTKKDNMLELSVISFLCGLSFCVKLSNAFFIIILFVVYWYYHKDLFKKINVKIVISVILSFLFPFFIYMLYTYLKTGNPVFPFYNQIFKSKYLAPVSWMDSRLGPKGIKEVLLWPIKMLFYPSRANDVYIIEPMWAFSYVIAIFYFIYELSKKIIKRKWNKERFVLSLAIILSFILWGKFSLGYVRYGLFVLLLADILVAVFIYEAYKKRRMISISIISLCLVYQSYYFVDQYVYKASFISFHNIFSEGISSYKYNLQHLFEGSTTKVELPKNAAFGPIAFDSGYLYMMNNKVPIMNLFVHKENLKCSYYDQRLQSLYNSYDKIYSGFATFKFNEFINNANYFGYQIESYYQTYKPSFLSENDLYYLFQVKKVDKANNTYSSQNVLKIDTLDKNQVKVNGFIGVNSQFLHKYSEVYLEIVDGEERRKLFECLDIQNGKLYYLDKELFLEDNSNITFRLVDSKGNQLMDVEFITINLRVS